ncbi:MAG: GNAT family N-acetyltransferase [Thermoplasmata archaeon]
MPSNPAALQIRPAERSDIPALVRCATTSVNESEDIGFGRPWSERTFTDSGRLSAEWLEPNRAGTEEIFVGEAEGKVVGYVTVEDRGEALELNTIEVAGDYQGRGFGRALVQFVEERARRQGKRAVTLGTSRNAHGVAWKSFPWWQARGYWVEGELENDWTRSIGPRVREIRMRKELV